MKKETISYPYPSLNNTESIGTRVTYKFIRFQYFRKIISNDNWQGK